MSTANKTPAIASKRGREPRLSDVEVFAILDGLAADGQSVTPDALHRKYGGSPARYRTLIERWRAQPNRKGGSKADQADLAELTEKVRVALDRSLPGMAEERINQAARNVVLLVAAHFAEE